MDKRTHKKNFQFLPLGIVFTMLAMIFSFHSKAYEKACMSDSDVRRIQKELDDEILKGLSKDESEQIKALDKKNLIHRETQDFANVFKQKNSKEKVAFFNKHFSVRQKTDILLENLEDSYHSFFKAGPYENAKGDKSLERFIDREKFVNYYSNECEKIDLEKTEYVINACAKNIDEIFFHNQSVTEAPLLVLHEETDPKNASNKAIYELAEKKLDKKKYTDYLNLLNHVRMKYLNEANDPICGLRDARLEDRCQNLQSIEKTQKSLSAILNLQKPIFESSTNSDIQKYYDEANLDRACQNLLKDYVKTNPKSFLARECQSFKKSIETKPKTAQDHYADGKVPVYNSMSESWVWEEPRSTGSMVAESLAVGFAGEFLPFWIGNMYTKASINYGLNNALNWKLGLYMQSEWQKGNYPFLNTLNYGQIGNAKGFNF